MAKYLELDINKEGNLCAVAKALDSQVRLQIIRELHKQSLNINEISEKLQIPASSAALHVRVLEKAELIRCENQPGERGSMKLCSIKSDFITIQLNPPEKKAALYHKVSMPIGLFTDSDIYPTCGLVSKKGRIGHNDSKESFYLPERTRAQILWSSRGYVEYTFPCDVPNIEKITKISFSLEVCSEAPTYREDWPSDLTVWINGQECGTWQSLGDFGARRGLLTPSFVRDGCTQYGKLTTWDVRKSGSYVNGQKTDGSILDDLNIAKSHKITFRIGNKIGAKCIGGFNLFGANAGDYPQDIIMTIE